MRRNAGPLAARPGGISGAAKRAKPLGIIAQDKVCRLIVRFDAIERAR
jgi:hypothetical protein